MIALLVGAAPSGSPSLVRSLAERADMVVGIDGGAAVCLAAAVSPDLVIGDIDSLNPQLAAQLVDEGTPFERHPAEKDETDLELAVRSIRRHGCDQVLLTGIVGDRFDHSLAGIGAVADAADLRPLIAETHVTIASLGPDGAHECSVVGSGTVFSAVAVDAGCVVSISGARWPLESADLPRLGSLGVSNRVTAGSARIRLHEGRLLVIVPTDGGAPDALRYED